MTEQDQIVLSKIHIGEKFEAEKKYLHAFQIYYAALNQFPDNILINLKIANFLETLKFYDKQLKFLNDRVLLFPESDILRIALAEKYIRFKRFDDALDMLSYFSAEDNSECSYLTAICYFNLNDLELARHFISFCLQSKNTQEQYYFNAIYLLAKIEIIEKNYLPALNNLALVKVYFEDNWEYFYLSAFAYYNLKMFTHSLKEIKRALYLNSENTEVRLLAGKIYFSLSDYQKAEKYFSGLLSDPDFKNVELILLLARNYLANKNYNDAIKYFQMAIKLEPENNVALEGMEKAKKLKHKSKSK